MKRHLILVLMAGTLLAGCARAPSLVFFGASFPDWLFCIAGGVLATTVVHALRGGKRLAWLDPVALTYPVLTTLCSLLVWLIFFVR